ncbi:RluA family pseudouridine synthase [Metabacillus herbersteinensis]|uniref:Pseudouridine synthase n=1 Tax=Metabacillus herbersteinensis TaxID=283816 RepID=A0ABV6GES3_9BACI
MRKKGEWFEWNVVKDWENQTIHYVLSEKIGASKPLIQKLKENNAIRKNDKHADVNHLLSKDDRLLLRIFQDEEYVVTPEYQTIDVLFEDDHLVILNKQAGIDTHPNEQGQIGTLANALASHFQMNGLSIKVSHIHRLDRDTSGAIIFAKNPLAHAILDKELHDRTVKRTYLAAVGGKVKRKKERIELSIGRDRHHPTRRRVSPNGQPAITNYVVIDYLPKEDISILSLQLESGRTHQIRVHLSHIGHPIIGDTLYGGSKNLIDRQALHAAKISLIHPITRESLEISAPVPSDMVRLMGE